MAVGRALRTALALSMVASASPAAAQAVARAVAIYPLGRADGADDAQALLESALRRAAGRTDDIVLSEPLVVRPACGAIQLASVECLSKMAGTNVLLRAVLHKSERSAALSIEAIDGKTGRAVGPMTVGVDLYIQNAEPLARALVMLFDDVRTAARRQQGPVPRPLVMAPPLTPVPKADAPKPDAAKPPPEKPDLRAEPPRAPAAQVTASRTEPKRSWARAAAPWVAGTGLALLAGAAVVSVKNQDLSNELQHKYQDGTLTSADSASYKKVDQYNQLTLILAASGGALTVTGAWMFTVTPSPGGAGVAMAGRF
jgi:hypothetical protein